MCHGDVPPALVTNVSHNCNSIEFILELVTCSSVLVMIQESGAPYSTWELSSRSEYNIKDPISIHPY